MQEASETFVGLDSSKLKISARLPGELRIYADASSEGANDALRKAP